MRNLTLVEAADYLEEANIGQTVRAGHAII